MFDVGANHRRYGSKSLLAGCLHTIAQEEPKMFDGVLACDEADTWKGSHCGYGVGLCLDQKAPRLADIELTASGGPEEGYAAVDCHLGA